MGPTCLHNIYCIYVARDLYRMQHVFIKYDRFGIVSLVSELAKEHKPRIYAPMWINMSLNFIESDEILLHRENPHSNWKDREGVEYFHSIYDLLDNLSTCEYSEVQVHNYKFSMKCTDCTILYA